MRAKPSTCALLFALCQPLAVAAALPEAGMSMKAVEAEFGQPLRKDAAVGNPPITRWEYSDSVVVFERSTVVHSMKVQRNSSPAQPVPAPAAKPAAPVPAAPVARPAAPAAATTAPATPAPAASAPAVSAPAVSAPAPAPAGREAAEADAMDKAAAEKAAAGSAAPAEAIPGATPDTAAPANETYTFDPETGRIIVK